MAGPGSPKGTATGLYRIGKTPKQLPHLDGRRRASVRFKKLVAQLAVDLGHEPSVGELALIRQAAAAICAAEEVEGRVLAGTATSTEIEELPRLANVVCRTIGLLGLNRADRRDTTGDLDAYLDAREKADTA